MKTHYVTQKTYSAYQPLVQLKEGRIVGYEALIRSSDNISPLEMIKSARRYGEIVNFDRMCRQKAIEGFSFKGVDRLLISINFDASVISHETIGSNHFHSLVEKSSLSPQNIVIEILETDVEDTELLKLFVQRYRAAGYLIALDDVGAGNSNLNRIPLIRPDIIKIDQYLIENYKSDFYKFEVLKSLIELGQRIGAVIIAEGIESFDQAVDLTHLGVDILQGFYFSKPQLPEHIAFDEINYKIGLCASLYRYSVLDCSRKKHSEFTTVTRCFAEVQDLLDDPFAILNILKKYPQVECIYTLDLDGSQTSETYCDWENLSIKNHLLFFPAKKGSDHAAKEYYLNAIALNTAQFTLPYVSKATGKLCITRSQVITHNGVQLILCVDCLLDSQQHFSNVCSY